MKEFAPVQEKDHVARGFVAMVGVASVIIIAISLAAVGWLMGGVTTAYGTPPPGAPTTIGTVEQTLILDAQRGPKEQASARAKLGALEWVDRDAGLARIPIERAMDLVVARDGGTP